MSLAVPDPAPPARSRAPVRRGNPSREDCMGRVRAPDGWHIPDESWAALGPLLPGPGRAPAPRPHPAGGVAPETLSRLAGCLVLVLAAGWCGVLLGSGWWLADSASALTFLVPFAAACGGLGGTLLAPRHRLPGLLGGAVG